MTILPNGIEVEGLAREFKGGVRAVDGIDLTVEPGEIYGFLGPNGAGKSTIVRMLTTLLKPTAGRATVAGFDVVSEAGAVRRSIGVALQDAAIDPLMTGRELVRLQAVLHGISKSDADRRQGPGRRLRRAHGGTEGALGDRRRAAGGCARSAPHRP